MIPDDFLMTPDDFLKLLEDFWKTTIEDNDKRLMIVTPGYRAYLMRLFSKN